MDIFVELAKVWGPPGLLAILLWFQLDKAEKREVVKDLRIQLLENKLTESYDERIEAASQITEAMILNAAKSEKLSELINQLVERRR